MVLWFKMGLFPKSAAAIEPSGSIVLSGDYMLLFLCFVLFFQLESEGTNK